MMSTNFFFYQPIVRTTRMCSRAGVRFLSLARSTQAACLRNKGVQHAPSTLPALLLCMAISREDESCRRFVAQLIIIQDEFHYLFGPFQFQIVVSVLFFFSQL